MLQSKHVRLPRFPARVHACDKSDGAFVRRGDYANFGHCRLDASKQALDTSEGCCGGLYGDWRQVVAGGSGTVTISQRSWFEARFGRLSPGTPDSGAADATQ